MSSPIILRGRRRSITLAWLCLIAPAVQAENPPTQEAVDACRALDDPARRLACYDAIPGTSVTGGIQPTETLHAAADRPANATLDATNAAPVDDLPFSQSPMTRRWELNPATHGGLLRIRRHEPVYILPARWSSNPNGQPQTPSRPAPGGDGDLDPFEVKFQVSLKTKVFNDLIGDNGDIWVGFTQQSNWQAFNSGQSSPFRETNYAPEVFTTWRTGVDLLGWRWQVVNLGFVHQSNGRSEPLSRSWNRLYAQFGFERGDLAVYLRPWVRVEADDNDDNPDIEDYLGHGDLRVQWRRNGHDLALMGRFAFDEQRGAIGLDWHYPLVGDLKAYLQLFHGYGESLVDYNHRQTTVGLGLSLVR